MEFTVFGNLNYRTLNPGQCHLSNDLQQPDTHKITKTSLDLFLPRKLEVKELSPANNLQGTEGFPNKVEGCSVKTRATFVQDNSILVIFVHGGGWRRGHTRNWQHFLSRFDTNLLVSLYSKYCNHYQNVGESFARSGYACAVVTYPLVAPPIRVVFVETVTSFLMSWMLFLIPLSMFYQLLSLLFYLTGVKSVLLHEMCTWNFQVCSSLLISQTFTKFLISTNCANYLTSSTSDGRHKPLLPKLLSSFMLASIIGVILYLIIFVCTIPQLSLVVSIDLICTQILITGLQIWNWSNGTDTAKTVTDQVKSVASAIRWLQDLAESNPGYYDHRRIALCGHSAGGTIVSLLGLEPRYLTSVGVDRSHIKGVISISGVCDVSSMDRSPSTRFFYLLPVFGEDSNEWKRMSPVHKVNKNSKWKSKFLLVSSSWEPIIRSDADEFEKRLLSAEFDCMRLKLTSKNHYSILNAFTTGTKLTVLEIACNKFIRELS
ncbi:uncharacterized protein [Apostichopus japonicus]|uniref:uncharacterized protein n=1 Tax=Stichopus japonicus TaxID=307972 RepID=UPI003AB2D2BF